MKKACLLIFALSCSIISFSQTWQWGQRGGTPVANTGGYGHEEDVDDIITDKNGNVYVISNIWNDQPNISGITFTTIWQQKVSQICIASYKCDGSLRWVKLMSDCGGKARAIKLDTLGNLYVSGYILNTSGRPACRIRSNTTVDTSIGPWPNPIYRTMFVMKMDTVGAFNWIRFPEPDTATYTGGSSTIYDMDVDENGNIFLLAALKPGAFAGGAFVANHSVGAGSGSSSADKCTQLYMLKYNTNGVFQSGHHLPFWFKGTASYTAYYKRDHNLHHNIISGVCGYIAGDTLKINGQQVWTSYVAAFDDNGNQLWIAQQDSAGQNGLIGTTENRVTIDNAGNIYYPGWGMDGYSFNGSVVNNTVFVSGVGFVVKMDATGHNIWMRNMSSDGSSSCLQTAVSGNNLGVWGTYGGFTTVMGNDTLHRPNNCGFRVYIARLDAATGSVTGVDSLQGMCGITHIYPASGGGSIDFCTGSITADPYGSFYVGGNMSNHVIVGNDTLDNIGGDQDWFIAKYGSSNCSVPVTVEEINNAITANLKVYPNPTTGIFTISADAAIDKVEIYNVVGAKVFTKKVGYTKTVVDIGNSVKGIYIYVLTLQDGSVLKGKVIVQ